MSTLIETIEIDDNTRLVVFADEDCVWDGYGLSEEEIANLPDPVGVVLERRYKWVKTNLDNAEYEERYEWEEEESIWGCYLDDTYTAQVVAQEYWGVVVAGDAS